MTILALGMMDRLALDTAPLCQIVGAAAERRVFMLFSHITLDGGGMQSLMSVVIRRASFCRRVLFLPRRGCYGMFCNVRYS